MHIESALQHPVGSSRRLFSCTRIHSGIAYLRANCDRWSSVTWTLRLFEVIVSRTALALKTDGDTDFDIRTTNPFKRCKNSDGDNGISYNTNFENDVCIPLEGLSEEDGNNFFGMGVGRDAEQWLQEILGQDIAGTQ